MTVTKTHVCSAYCTPPEHCELIYLTPNAKRGHLWQAYAGDGVWVTDAMPARESPQIDLAAWHRGDGYINLTGSTAGTEPWLVWWRTDYQEARADYDADRIPEFRTEL